MLLLAFIFNAESLTTKVFCFQLASTTINTRYMLWRWIWPYWTITRAFFVRLFLDVSAVPNDGSLESINFLFAIKSLYCTCTGYYYPWCPNRYNLNAFFWQFFWFFLPASVLPGRGSCYWSNVTHSSSYVCSSTLAVSWCFTMLPWHFYDDNLWLTRSITMISAAFFVLPTVCQLLRFCASIYHRT